MPNKMEDYDRFLQGATQPQNAQQDFNFTAFFGFNIVVLAIISFCCGYLLCFSGRRQSRELSNNNNSSSTNPILSNLFVISAGHNEAQNRSERIQRQQQIEDSKYVEDPVKRRERIKLHFYNSKCRMVVKAEDIEMKEFVGRTITDDRHNDKVEAHECKLTNKMSSSSIHHDDVKISISSTTPVTVETDGEGELSEIDSRPPPQKVENIVDDDELLESGYLVLGGSEYNSSRIIANNSGKSSSSTVQNPSNNRYGLRVMNCCAICLSPYEEGDIVVWSDNQSDCQHAFHEDCILDWMCKVQQTKDDIQTPCPICRQNFLSNLSQYYDGKYIKKQNQTPPERTFNLNSISWR